MSNDHLKQTKAKRSSIGRFEALADAQKAAAIADFDQEFIAARAKPLRASQRRDWDRFKRKAKASKAVAMIRVELDQSWLMSPTNWLKRRAFPALSGLTEACGPPSHSPGKKSAHEG